MSEEMNTNEIKATLATTEELLAEINRLTEEVARLNNVIEYTGAHLKSWAEKWDRAAKLYEASLEESGVDTDDLGENDRALVEMFGIEFTEETEVVVNVSWTVTVTHPKGYNFGDLDININEPDLFSTTGQEIEVGHFYSPDVEIEEA